MLPFTPIETSDTLVVRLDHPERFNDSRSDDYRDSLFQSVLSKTEPLVALDLSPVDFLSSTGIAILVGLKRPGGGNNNRKARPLPDATLHPGPAEWNETEHLFLNHRS